MTVRYKPVAVCLALWLLVWGAAGAMAAEKPQTEMEVVDDAGRRVIVARRRSFRWSCSRT